MSDEKYTTVSIKDEDREILDKIKQLEKLQSKSQVVTKIIKESKYNSINRIIEEKFDEIRDMIPTERLDDEYGASIIICKLLKYSLKSNPSVF